MPSAVWLKDLARTGRLPDHQVMDQPTLTWIAEHRPAEASRTVAVTDPPGLLTPEPAWFTSRQAADGIHGIRHNARVCLLAGLLARQHRLEPDEDSAVRLAAAVHDCRRRNDRADPGHGQRAASWLARHHPAVTAAFDLDLPARSLTAAGTAIGLHDIPYSSFSPAHHHAHRRAEPLTDLLKAADCLDRYRLPLTRWWPDTSQLRVPVPDWLHGIAFDLMLHSEQARLEGASHHDALVHARQIISHLP
ncbi:hypothetical protein ACFYY8_02625 [Streptosporangium sp. NPDC001559]|uniref:hypothetical protein n=1 Tax=Streptosporangium sp. NPDC001559 TaxID=3366187 RepID=UPI0036EF8EAC